MISSFDVCPRCLMDSTAKDFYLNPDGNCNFCSDFISNAPFNHEPCKFNTLIDNIKSTPRSSKYDCVIGLSGGVDSSWALVQACEAGLNPLVVHLDNGWNSELTQNNIYNLVSKLGVDYYSHVIEWSSYKMFLLSFLKANVVDIELLMDNAMISLNYRMASRHKIKWILAGTNKSTEGIQMPNEWNWFKYDKSNIKSIAKGATRRDFSSLKPIGTLDLLYYTKVCGIKWLSFLDYTDYIKDVALDKLVSEYSYRPYPYKHYESILTRFYQGYILPNKFGIDKRKLHLSTLVMTNQMSRDEGLELLAQSPYPSSTDLESDIDYFLKKLDWSREDLSHYIETPAVPHDSYKTELPLWNLFYSSWFSKFIRNRL